MRRNMKFTSFIQFSRISFLIIAFFFSKSIITGQVFSEYKASSIAENFVNHYSNNIANYNIKGAKLIDLGENNSVYLFQLNPIGFLLVSANNFDVIGFSFENNFSLKESKLKLVSSFLNEEKNTHRQTDLFRNPNNRTVGPLVKSLYGQVNCYDNDDKLINVSNLFTPNNYAPGCVAVSLSTLLQYYQWPIKGMGKHKYSDNKGSSNGTYQVDYGKTEYEWENILDRYNYKNTSLKQREALGELVYHSAVALDMDFEFNGSTSNVNRIPKAGKNYFRFIAREVPASSFIFWKTVDSNLVHKTPVIFSISASNGAGHSIVCDGFKYDNGSEYHHVNMGWWGTSNGWYKIRNGFKVGGYNKIDHGIIDFIPTPMLNELQINNDSTEFSITWNVSKVLLPETFELQYKTDESGWTKISDTLTAHYFSMDIDPEIKEYTFRVKAKVNGKWYTDSWSNTVKYIKHSTANDDVFVGKADFYPNPFHNQINIKLNGEYTISLYSSEGRLIYSKIESGMCIVKTNNLPKGMYILKLQNKSKLFVSKLIKPD